MIVHVTGDNFESVVLQSEKPVLIDFSADWCMPCRMVKPELEKAASLLDGTAVVAKVDVDASPEVAGAFGIRGIPAFAVVKGGKIVDMWSGYCRASDMVARAKAPAA